MGPHEKNNEWENEELNVPDGKIDIKLVNAYPHIPA